MKLLVGIINILLVVCLQIFAGENAIAQNQKLPPLPKKIEKKVLPSVNSQGPSKSQSGAKAKTESESNSKPKNKKESKPKVDSGSKAQTQEKAKAQTQTQEDSKSDSSTKSSSKENSSRQAGKVKEQSNKNDSGALNSPNESDMIENDNDESVLDSEPEQTINLSVKDAEKIPVRKVLAMESKPLENSKNSGVSPGRSVLVQMSEVANARSFEIQVKPFKQMWKDPFIFKTPDTRLRFRMQPDHYRLRARSFDITKTPGDWGNWVEFWVPLQSLRPLYPVHGTIIAPKANKDEVVTFEWPKVERAKLYRFYLFDQDDNLIKRVQMTTVWHLEKLKLGKVYKWLVVPMLSADEPENLNPVERYVFAVDFAPLDSIPVKIEIEKRDEVKSYEYEIVEILSDTRTSEPSSYKTREPNFRARLRPGKYELRVRYHYEDGGLSHWGAPRTFLVRVPPPAPITPTGGLFIDPNDDLEAKVLFKWKPSEYAYQYRVYIYNDEGKLVKQEVSKEPELLTTLLHNQKYRWQVAGELKMQIENRGVAVENATGPSDSTPVNTFELGFYKRLELAPAEEPAKIFAWGRWIGSMINYETANYDNNNIVSQNIFAGTGELALGGWSRKTGFGLLGIGQYGGFSVYDQIHNFKAASLLLGKRMILDGGQRLRVWGGVGYREVPEVTIDGATSKVGFSNITTNGIEMRASFADTMKGPWGYQCMATGYASSKALKTTNGNVMTEMYSYSMGAYGTYRLESGNTIMGGYTYQRDHAGYKSYDRTGGVNTVDYSGHFLSLFMQYGLIEPER